MGRELSRPYLANLFDLSGHVAVVAGGNGGIGRSIALGLAQAGAAIAAWARNEEKNQRVLGELKALGGPASALRVGVTVWGQLQPALHPPVMANQLVARRSRVDTVFTSFRNPLRA
jgi:NAD(P)-dependent dehydrogenase (short-subunit alcohol dehydrogenase family)